MSPRKTAKVAFLSALILLLFCGVAALVVVPLYMKSAQWVVHTYEVKDATRTVESTMAEAGRDRLSYITFGSEIYLTQYEWDKRQVSEDLLRVQQLTLDNPSQQKLFAQLQSLASQRIELLQSSIDGKRAGKKDDEFEQDITLQLNKVGTQFASVVSRMQRDENSLLESRKNNSSTLFAAIVWIGALLLASAFSLLWIHYRLLNDELGKREAAESGARRLSAHVLELQDEERRKFARELHDSLGQNLAVAKMIAFGMSERMPAPQGASELIELLDKSLQETRTISHLLHPPLLDELGIASAVSWYVDGFSQRSGLKISLKISEGIGRLPRPAELVLFRVLQESLTNVHRHSKSAKADVNLSVVEEDVVLQVRDYGVGIPAEKLHHFRSDGTMVGVGLTGMRERVREQGGQFEIYSDGTGTEVFITLPLTETQAKEEAVAAPRTADGLLQES